MTAEETRLIMQTAMVWEDILLESESGAPTSPVITEVAGTPTLIPQKASVPVSWAFITITATVVREVILQKAGITVIEAGPITVMMIVVREIILQETDMTVDDVHTGTLVGSIPQVETRSHKADIRVDEVYTGTLMDPVRITETSPRKIDIMVNEALMSAVVRFLHKVTPKEMAMTLEEVHTGKKMALVQRILRIKAKVMGKVPSVVEKTWKSHSQ